MKLRADRNFQMQDRKRGIMVTRQKGEQFDVDVTEQEDARDVYSLLRGRRATVVDPAFIPLSARYTVLHSFSFSTKEGFPRVAKVNDEIELNQMDGNQYLASGHVKPANPNAWTLAKLLEPGIKEDVVKKMYDQDPLPAKESWVTKGVRREDR